MSLRPFRWLSSLFHRPPEPEPEAVEDYRAAILPLLERAERLYQQWLEDVETVSDSERLANIASTQSWELATLSERLQACTPPEALAGTHAKCTEAFRLTRRAGQLLSTGYRYHSSDALCDGHALLDDACQIRHTVLQRLGVDHNGNGHLG